MQEMEKPNEPKGSVISDNIVIKKMRLIRKQGREEAALIFNYSRSSIEKLENGRGELTPERVRRFIEGYGFTQNLFMDLKLGRLGDVLPAPTEIKKIGSLSTLR